MSALHPDCAAYLEDLKALRMPASTPREVRARYAALCARYAGPPLQMPVRDLSGPVPCRLYGDAAGLLLWFHGGRMVSGDLDTHDALCRRLALYSGRRVLAVDYRLAPEHPCPAALDDALAALDLAATLAPRFAVGGDSAGASLALAAAFEASALLNAVVAVYPMIDATQSLPSHREFDLGPGTSGRDIALGYQWWLPPGADPCNPRVSPLFDTRWQILPRTLVLTAGVDPLRDEGLDLVGKLRRGSVPVELIHYPDHLHGFLTYPARFVQADHACRSMGRFLAAGG